VNKVYDGNTTATVTLSDNRVAGDVLTTSYASATFTDKNVGTGKPVSVSGISISGGDAGNYTSNTTASTTATITQRALTISATGVNKVYDGNTTATVTLSDNRVAGDVLTTSYASATFADKNVGTAKPVSVSGISISGGDAGNYTSNTTASTTANITPANSNTQVTCPTAVVFSGSPQTPCSTLITGAGGLSLTPTPAYANNTGPGMASASYTFVGDGNHFGSSGSAAFLIQYSSGPCLGSPGRQVLQPINADGSSVFKQGSTVPAKFRVCDAAGNSIGTPGLVTSFVLSRVISGTDDHTVNESVVSTTPDTAFRWDPTDKQWIFNINTKNLTNNKTYVYLITLNDTTTIEFRFGLK
jgi:hypothetical protein